MNDQKVGGSAIRGLGLRAARRFRAAPRDALADVAAVVRARLALRVCRQLGPLPRLHGRCRVSGGAGIEVGQRLVMMGGTVRCELTTHAGGRLIIGDRVFINYGTSISAHTLVQIGDGCKLGQYTILLDCDYHSVGRPRLGGGHGAPAPIVLEEEVWLAARVTVLKGVTIGRGSVIAAGAVVTRDIPAGVIAAGVPARVIRPC